MDIKQLRQSLSPLPVFHKDVTASTNQDAKAHLLSGGALPAVFVAGAQTTGRGRLGRDFASPPGGLYLTLALPHTADNLLLTTQAALAAAESVEAMAGLPCQIKWVNDLIINDKKVAGLLAEGVYMGDQPLGTVMGYGLNVAHQNFPDDLRDKAGALADWLDTPPALNVLATAFVTRLLALLPLGNKHLPLYERRCLTLGKRVQALGTQPPVRGLAVGISAGGGLIIRDEKGIRHTITSGEVSIGGADSLSY